MASLYTKDSVIGKLRKQAAGSPLACRGSVSAFSAVEVLGYPAAAKRAYGLLWGFCADFRAAVTPQGRENAVSRSLWRVFAFGNAGIPPRRKTRLWAFYGLLRGA